MAESCSCICCMVMVGARVCVVGVCIRVGSIEPINVGEEEEAEGELLLLVDVMDGAVVVPSLVLAEGDDEVTRLPVGGDEAPLGNADTDDGEEELVLMTVGVVADEDGVCVGITDDEVPALVNALGATLGTFDGNPVVPSSVSLFMDDSLLVFALLGA